MSVQDVDTKAMEPAGDMEPAGKNLSSDTAEKNEPVASANISEASAAPSGRRGETFVPRLVVLGVGGAGGNVINNLMANDLRNVDFMVANTDMQDLEKSTAPVKIQLGVQTTQGLGTGADPDQGKLAAEESIEEVLRHLHGTHLLFITAGMGGGTGTGATSVIARRAREMGILTLGMLTKPFEYEGLEKMRVAETAITQLKDEIDKLVVISNQNLFAMANEQTTLADGFLLADKVLSSGIAGITEAITRPGLINVDFADVRTVMEERGESMLGTGEAEGPERAINVINHAIENRLVDDVRMNGASTILLNITGDNVTMHETHAISERLREEAGENARLLMGVINDPDMAGCIKVCVMAAGIQNRPPGPVMRSHPPQDEASVSSNGLAPTDTPPAAENNSNLGMINENLPSAIQPRAKDEPIDQPRKKGFFSGLFATHTPMPDADDVPDSKTSWFNRLLGDPDESDKVNAHYDAERMQADEEKAPEPETAPPPAATQTTATPAAPVADKAPVSPTPAPAPAPERAPAPQSVKPKTITPRPAPTLNLEEKRRAKAARKANITPGKVAPTDASEPESEQLEIPTFLRRQNS